MTKVQLLSESELSLYARIAVDAYPGVQYTAEQFLEGYQRNFAQEHVHFWGVFEDDVLLGAYQHYDFLMTVRDRPVPVGGIGGVAVGVLNRKRRAAYHLLQNFVRTSRANEQPLTWLYPFRPDFYRKMGYGYGLKQNQFRIQPAGLPRAETDHVRFAEKADQADLLDCYNRYTAVTHGMIRRRLADFDRHFEAADQRVLICRRDETVQGYLIYKYLTVPGSFLANDLLVVELVYTEAAAMRELLGFLNLLADQVGRIVVNTQDEYFHLLLDDPRNGSGNMVNLYHESSVQGLGLMPRVVDTPGLFAALNQHNFGGQSVRLRLTIEDDFLPENSGDTVLHVVDGHAQVVPGGEWDVTLRLHVRDFSSLIVGAVSLPWLHRNGLATLDKPELLPTLDRLLGWVQKPICMTRF